MTTEDYRHWLQDAIQGCESQDADAPHYDHCGSVIRQAGRIALQLGLPNIYRLCRVRPGPLASETARIILAECLAALPTRPRETITIEELQTITGWSRTTIWRRRVEGKLPEPRTEGGKLYWLHSDLEGIL